MLITHSLDEAALLSDRIGIMSSRPGQFMDVIKTNWSIDRDSKMATSPEFRKITSLLWEKLRKESEKALGDN